MQLLCCLDVFLKSYQVDFSAGKLTFRNESDFKNKKAHNNSNNNNWILTNISNEHICNSRKYFRALKNIPWPSIICCQGDWNMYSNLFLLMRITLKSVQCFSLLVPVGTDKEVSTFVQKVLYSINGEQETWKHQWGNTKVI